MAADRVANRTEEEHDALVGGGCGGKTDGRLSIAADLVAKRLDI